MEKRPSPCCTVRSARNQKARENAKFRPAETVALALEQTQQLGRWAETESPTADLAKQLMGTKLLRSENSEYTVYSALTAEKSNGPPQIRVVSKINDFPDGFGLLLIFRRIWISHDTVLMSGNWSNPVSNPKGNWMIDGEMAKLVLGNLEPGRSFNQLQGKIMQPNGACWIPDKDPYQWVIDALDAAVVTDEPGLSALAALMPMDPDRGNTRISLKGVLPNTPSSASRAPFSSLDVLPPRVELEQLPLLGPPLSPSPLPSISKPEITRNLHLFSAEHDEVPVTPLLLANALDFRALQPGKGARLDKRLLIYSLTSIPYALRRPGGHHLWNPPLEELIELLWRPTRGGPPYGYRATQGGKIMVAIGSIEDIQNIIHCLRITDLSWKKVADRLNEEGYRTREQRPWTKDAVLRIVKGRSSYEPKKRGSALVQTFNALSLAHVLLPDGRQWFPVLTRVSPNPYDRRSRALIEIRLPLDGPVSGPEIPFQSLVDAGMISDPAFDLELALSYHFDAVKRQHGGRRIYATRPQVLRGKDGVILNDKVSP